MWFQDEARIGQQGTLTRVPKTMTLLFLPPYAPELMPMERVWHWMRQHDLSNRVFNDEAAIDRACAQSWNKLTADRFKSITATQWISHKF